MPDFVCPTCGNKMARDLAVIMLHTEGHIVDVIKKKHPDWVEADGICKRCYEHYKKMRNP